MQRRNVAVTITKKIGHATFGGALVRFLQLAVGTDDFTFSFESDEFNGITLDNLSGKPRNKVTRWYTSFTNYAWENAQSRIYLGMM